VIADVVSYTIAGIDFIHAAGRLFLRKGFTARMNTGMRLAAHKVPRPWRFVSHFPQTTSGKSQESILREQRLKG
jgi:acyl-CoA synthetase (AMP-forming)/AMP-acid ligase II